MIKAQYDNKMLIVEILMKSFHDNQSVNYLVQQDHKILQRQRALMEYSFEMCFRYGDVWLSNNKQACALALYPHQKKTTIHSIWLDIKLIFQTIGIRGIIKALKREAIIKKKQCTERMLYLWFIGVDPISQHAGIGSVLLREVIEEAEKKSLAVYLETSTLRNLPWYERFNFDVYNKVEFSYTLYFLRRVQSK